MKQACTPINDKNIYQVKPAQIKIWLPPQLICLSGIGGTKGGKSLGGIELTYSSTSGGGKVPANIGPS